MVCRWTSLISEADCSNRRAMDVRFAPEGSSSLCSGHHPVSNTIQKPKRPSYEFNESYNRCWTLYLATVFVCTIIVFSKLLCLGMTRPGSTVYKYNYNKVECNIIRPKVYWTKLRSLKSFKMDLIHRRYHDLSTQVKHMISWLEWRKKKVYGDGLSQA